MTDDIEEFRMIFIQINQCVYVDRLKKSKFDRFFDQHC